MGSYEAMHCAISRHMVAQTHFVRSEGVTKETSERTAILDKKNLVLT